MRKNILTYLENSAQNYSDKVAVKDANTSYTFKEEMTNAQAIGTLLIDRISPREPVGVYSTQSANTLISFFGAVYAGGCYCYLNPELPDSRLCTMTSVLKARVILTDQTHYDHAKEIFKDAEVMLIEEAMKTSVNEEALVKRGRRSVDTDPLYLNFTSGSTGVPKGILVSHRSTMDFMDYFTELFHITSEDVIANQAPFDFDVSVKDIYSHIKTGATLVVIERSLFSNPTGLIDTLVDNNVTTMIWAVSALCLLTTFHALDYKVPTTINKIMFSGEVMPYKALKNFKEHLPNAMYVNLYGPTEITCNCTYHILEKDRDYSKKLPAGKPFPNEDVFLLDDNNHLIEDRNITGEICVRGTALALGYFENEAANNKSFVQNPLNPHYPEKIYRTGDLAYYDENDDLCFNGRKDFQIKYRGHRIELEEVEREMNNVDGVERCACVFDHEKSKLKGFYIGSIDKRELHKKLSSDLPAFMIPGTIRQIEEFPLNKNGKIDRKQLLERGR